MEDTMDKKNGNRKRTVKDLPARNGQNVRGGWFFAPMFAAVAAPSGTPSTTGFKYDIKAQKEA